jgi:hypothetical protein
LSLAAALLARARDRLIVANLGIRQIYVISVNAGIIVPVPRADGAFDFYGTINFNRRVAAGCGAPPRFEPVVRLH